MNETGIGTLPKIESNARPTYSHHKWDEFNAEAMQFVPDLKRVALWLTRNSTDAEDLVQDTLFNAMRSFHLYTLGTDCRAWMMTIMHNLQVRRLQKLARMKIVDDPDGEILSSLHHTPHPEADRLNRNVERGLNKLPPYFRDVVVLSDIHEYSYKEISKALKVPLGTVMSRLSRGRRILRNELRGHVPFDSRERTQLTGIQQ